MKIERKAAEPLPGNPSPDRLKWGLFVAFEGFTGFTLLYSLRHGRREDILMCILTVFLVAFLYGFERLFQCRMNRAFYVFAMLYIIGPMVGESYRIYYITAHYDKLLHTCAGALFAVLGSYIPVWMNPKYREDIGLRAVFAVLFSVTVAAAWEFFEFGLDMLLETDMQNDTIIHSIHSYLLGTEPGATGSIPTIDSVVVNGVAMEGYIDIGLIDTMVDMLVETAGAIGYALLFALDRDRNPVFQRA